jgi:glutamine synthetase
MPGTSGHIHVSIRDKSGRNIFAVTEEEKKAGGREGAAFDDTKYLSQEAEWFLAGLLEGLSDGMSLFSGAMLSITSLPTSCSSLPLSLVQGDPLSPSQDLLLSRC